MVNEIIENAKKDVENFLKDEGLQKYEIEVQGQSESGENYLGEIIFIKVKTPDEDLNLVVKKVKRNEFLKASAAYQREISVYTKIFPAYRDFLRENRSDIKLDFVPTVCWANQEENDETLIFENLKSIGYELHDRLKPWNMEHSMLVMEHYGKLHGISFSLKMKKPEVFKKITKDFSDVFKELIKEIDAKEYFDRLFKDVFEALQETGRNDLIRKLNALVDEFPKIVLEEADEEDRIVVTHADCWNNNFLFKYQNGIPSEVVFLDFQISKLDSPVVDICYNIYATCDNKSFDNIDQLLKTYYKSFSKTAEDLGCKPTESFSYDKFMEHWKKYSKNALGAVPLILKVALVSKEDAPNLKDLNEEQMKNFFHDIVVKNCDEYKRRLKDVFVHYLDNFYDS